VSGVVMQRAVTGPTVVRSRRSGDSRCPAGMLIFVDGRLANAPGAIGGSRGRWPREDSLALRRPRSGGTPGGRAAQRAGIGRSGGQLLGGDPAAMVDATTGVNTSSLFDLNVVPLSTLAGVEVYPTLAGVPAEFRVPGAECGVVLVWMAG
jgi:hypothetical protein